MLKIEEGMYVRFKDLTNYQKNNNTLIDKVKFISEVMCGLEETLSITLEKYNEDILKKDIIKSSKNIIDLIEGGDYVNGMRIVAKDSDNRLYVAEDLGQPYDRGFYNGCFEYTILDERFKIKTILTKEQFENNCYNVEEQI